MTTQGLPIKLKKEPLVDAVFEIRFSSLTAASSVLPGFFFAKLEPKEWQIEPLPVASIPSQIRTVDPNLRDRPIMRIHWDNFVFLVGDSALGVGCKIPYAGWAKFRERIIKAVELLVDTKIVQNIERYSIKYVDIVEGQNLAEQIQSVNIDIRVGGHTIKEELFTVRAEIPNHEFLNIIQVAASATATTPDGRMRKGTLVDIDTLCNYQTNDLKKFLIELPTRLDEIHNENKRIFFQCLKPETITYLEPVYE